MTLRNPRRRISPRTKHRYRAVREFFRRALGSSSQPDININSSIAINVTDLKHKIVGLENELDAVSRHCRDLIYLDSSSRNDSRREIPAELYRDIHTIKERTEESDVKSNDLETKILFKKSESQYINLDNNEYVPKPHKNNGNVTKNKSMNPENYDPHFPKESKKRLSNARTREFSQNVLRNKTKSVCNNFDSAYSTSSFRSLNEPRVAELNDAGFSGRRHERKHVRSERIDPMLFNLTKHKKHKEENNLDDLLRNCEDTHGRNRKNKHIRCDLDQDFIKDIIKRQYKPVKIFGRKESGISQFSAPVCRDQEFSIHENILEGTELCSCLYGGHSNSNPMHYHEFNDIRSVCDTRLYSSKRHSRSRHRKKLINIYNDSDLYDLVPVKEKASPKSRRKFAEDITMTPYDYYREVPPSPRTHRPRLNLKSQHHEIDNYIAHIKRHSKKDKLKKRQQNTDSVESDISSEIAQNLNVRYHKLQKPKVSTNNQNQQHYTATMSSVQCPNIANEQTNLMIDTTLNKTQDTDLSVDKADKALCEIKDILQNFLLEIKKESTASQCDKSDISMKTEEKIKGVSHNDTQTNTNTRAIPNSGHNFNNYSVAHCSMPPYMSGFNNSCCYPIMPVCPMNCVQNGYIVPSPSFTCATCVNNNYREHPKDNAPLPNKEQEIRHSETDELIKEIYKFIAQSPTVVQKHDQCQIKNENISREEKTTTNSQNMVTCRKTSTSSKTSKHDAKVGTPNIKCYSKSCEAIASRLVSEADYSGTNASYSDTVLEKLSLEPTTTRSTSDTESSIQVNKNKGNKLGKILRSFGLFKKKDKDIIEEVSESESAVDIEVEKKPPFRQDITNYMMHGQEYFHPQPLSPHYHPYRQQPYEHLHQQNYHPVYNPRVPGYPMPPPPANDAARNDAARHYHSPPHPSAPPFPQYETSNMPPQVPLCLKEIEVKSTGTQSVRKMSLFGKIKKKMQPPGHMIVRNEENPQRNCSTQTAQTIQVHKKPGLFNWKNLQAKVGALDGKTDPMNFSYKTQKRLAEGDIKIRNDMLKRMFYKKNPFSPRNLIVRTLLGKDRTSYGEPVAQFRPRMFF